MFVALRIVTLSVLVVGGLLSTRATAQTCPPLLNHTFAKLQDESPQPLCQYQGRVLLVVNTASYCGFTSQYDGLEKLHVKYAARGLTVLGFPSGDFGNQEKANNKEIADFCYNTTRSRFHVCKVFSAGPSATIFHGALQIVRPARMDFHKYLIDREGRSCTSQAIRRRWTRE